MSINELKDAFYSLKTKKSPGYGDISSNIIKQCFGTLNRPLHYIYNISLQSGIFPEETKIAGVTPIFKRGEVSDLENYLPISALCCFSKILEKILYNGLNKHLLNNNIIYKKQFAFQENHSTDQAIIQLLRNYSIIQLFNYSTCGVPQGSILGPLVFLLYINNLPDACPVLDPILYADDANLLYSNNDIETLFSIVNMELEKISEWFKANKLSLNIKKTNYTLFYKNSTKDDLSLKLPDLKIVNSVLKSQASIKF